MRSWRTLFVNYFAQYRWLFLLISLFLAANALLYSLYYPFGHDEHMYITAPWMLGQGGQLYQTVSFLQTPLLPYLYHGLFALFDFRDQLLFLPRLINGLAFVGVAVCVGLSGWTLTRQRWFGWIFFVISLLHEVILFSSRQADNAILPLFLLALGTWIWLREWVREDNQKGFWLLFGGLCFGLAVSLKLYYLTLLPGFFLGTLLLSWFSSRRWRPVFTNAISLVSGMLLGLLPSLLFFIRSPEAFLFQNVTYHVLNAAWREAGGYVGVSLAQKVTIAYDLFARPINIFLGVVFVQTLAFLSLSKKWKKIEPLRRWVWVILLFQFLVALLTAFFPTPVMPNYFTQSFFFLMLLVQLGLSELRFDHLVLQKALCTGLLIVCAFSLPKLVRFLPAALSGRPMISSQVHTTGQEVRRLLSAHGFQTGRIATLAPLFALEGGYDTYSAFVTGPFLYRVGDLLTPQQRHTYGLASSSTLATYLDQDPPVAVYLACERDPGVEAAFFDYVERNRYQHLPSDRLGCGRLYVRPKAK